MVTGIMADTKAGGVGGTIALEGHLGQIEKHGPLAMAG